MGVALIAAHAGHGADAVAHAVHTQLRPTYAPQIGRDGGAVNWRKKALKLLDARRHPAVHFTDEERCRVEVARHRPAHVTRFIEVDGEIVSHNASDGPAPADDAGNGLLVDRILRRDDVSPR